MKACVFGGSSPRGKVEKENKISKWQSVNAPMGLFFIM